MKYLILTLCIWTTSTMSYAASYEQVWQVVESKEPVTKISSEKKISSLYQVSENQFEYPNYEVNLERMIEWTANGFVDHLKKAVDRTLNETQDTYPVLNKLLHSNGICFSGVWTINKKNPYTGLFKNQTQVPLIARASVTLSGTKQDESRGFALALKLFPNQEDTETKNIFLIDVLGGRVEKYFLNASMSNQPEIGFSFNFGMVAHVLKTFALADANPSYRPVDHVAEDTEQEARAPKWIAVVPAKTNKLISKNDFREELYESAKQKPITYKIMVSETEPQFKEASNWTQIGTIQLTNPTITYGCDRRLHFAHPKIIQ